MGLFILIIIAVVVFLVISSNRSGNQDRSASHDNYRSNEAHTANDSDEDFMLTSSLVGTMLEDRNEHDSDKGWFAKGVEDEFDINSETGDYNDGSNGSDSSDSSSGYDSGDSSFGGDN